jgi:uroporphyrinogen decarboxylase
MLSPTDYQEFSWQYINQIVEALSPLTHVVVFGKGCWFALEDMTMSKASALGVDWTIKPEFARTLTNHTMTLQGNFDPARLHSTPETIKKMVNEMINRFGKDRYIANLGHGILPNVPVENAEAFIRAVVDWKPTFKNQNKVLQLLYSISPVIIDRVFLSLILHPRMLIYFYL